MENCKAGVEINKMNTYNFDDYKDSIWILDQSASQSFQSFHDSRVIVEDFLASKNISLNSSEGSKSELVYQIQNTLLGCSVESSETYNAFSDDDYLVISSSDGSFIEEKIDPCSENKIEIVSLTNQSTTYQNSLFDCSPPYKRMESKAKRKNKPADIDNINLARFLNNQGKKSVVFVNDKDQSTQLSRVEGFKVFDPLGLLLWLAQDKFINPQKAVCIFEKWKKDIKSRGWIKDFDRFK
jgi:hypothetical protein